MLWVHPFTSVISGPTGKGKSVCQEIRTQYPTKHEMFWIVCIGNVKCVEIVGLYLVISFFRLPLYFVLIWKESIWLLLWGKRVWLLLLLWGKRVWLLLLVAFEKVRENCGL
jgi:hypothetical protein